MRIGVQEAMKGYVFSVGQDFSNHVPHSRHGSAEELSSAPPQGDLPPAPG